MESAKPLPEFKKATPAPEAPKGEERLLVLQKNTVMLDIRGHKIRVIHIKSKSELLPTLFFFHGAGGRAEQWLEQISYYYKRVTIVAMDLLGHGDSEVTDELEDYTSASMVSDMCEVFNRYHGMTNLFFAHSYGCSLVAKMLPRLPQKSVAGVAMCAPTLLAPGDVIHKPFHFLPIPLLNVLRYLDRWGGITSNSVKRMLHDSASDKLKEQQLAWNASTSTKVVKMMLESLDLATLEDYQAITVPFCLVSGEDDRVTPCRLARMIIDAIEANNGPESAPSKDPTSAHYSGDVDDNSSKNNSRETLTSPPMEATGTDTSSVPGTRTDTGADTGGEPAQQTPSDRRDLVVCMVQDMSGEVVGGEKPAVDSSAKMGEGTSGLATGLGLDSPEKGANGGLGVKELMEEDLLRSDSLGVTDASAEMFGSGREYPDDSEVEGKPSDGEGELSACESEKEGDRDDICEDDIVCKRDTENGEKNTTTSTSVGPKSSIKGIGVDAGYSTENKQDGNADADADAAGKQTDNLGESSLKVTKVGPLEGSGEDDTVSDLPSSVVIPQHAEEVEEGRKLARQMSHSRNQAKQDAEATAALRSGCADSGNENQEASKVISRKTTGSSTRSLSAAASAEGRSKHMPQSPAEDKMVELHIISECGHQVMLEKKSIFNAVVNNFFIQTAGVTVLDRLHRLNRGDSVHDKWALKNYEKWSKTLNFGEAILFKNNTRGFVPMKVLRQDDANHSPSNFISKNKRVGVVLDLTSQAPPYNTKDESLPLYIKLAAESKKVPSKEYVKSFIQTVDNFWKNNPDSLVAVHCHYGFNRTGFLLASYLIERADYSVEEAIAAFKQSRPKGIRHQHFLDELFLRYTRRSSSVANKH